MTSDFIHALCGHYNYTQEVVCLWILANEEAVAKRLYEDPDGAPAWAHNVISLETQWS